MSTTFGYGLLSREVMMASTMKSYCMEKNRTELWRYYAVLPLLNPGRYTCCTIRNGTDHWSSILNSGHSSVDVAMNAHTMRYPYKTLIDIYRQRNS